MKMTESKAINSNLPDGFMASEIKRGEYVRRKPDANKTYKLGAYDRSEKKYELHDEDDISRSIYVSGKTKLYLKFDY